MIIYSEAVATFISRLRGHIKEIFTEELNIKFNKSRFVYGGYSIPLNIVVFEKQNLLGSFDALTYQIGINKGLMYSAKTAVIKDVLRHEIAHLIAFLEHKDPGLGHGREFKEVCKRYNWREEVSYATANLETANSLKEGDLLSERLIAKVQKLLKLATSSNEHEAELATIKANQLMVKHNLQLTRSIEVEQVYVLRPIKGKRATAKYHAIYEILKLFMVQPVFNYGKGGFYLEIIGDKTNVELAEYVAIFLDKELDNLWKTATKNAPSLKGARDKNSFMRGVAKGYCDKIKTAQTEVASGKELIIIEQNLKRQVKLVYSRLGHVARSASPDNHHAKNAGVEAGRKLNINPGIKSSKKTGLLSFLRR